jgi:hypothetical protein
MLEGTKIIQKCYAFFWHCLPINLKAYGSKATKFQRKENAKSTHSYEDVANFNRWAVAEP